MARKTIPLASIIDQLNTRLATPDSTLHLEGLTPEQAFRLGALSLVESVLFQHGAYKGFQYTDEPKGADTTRRRYYAS